MQVEQLRVTPASRASLHPAEWEARQELAACYRIFAMLGWTEMIYNHITLRLPSSVSGGNKEFLINPFGLHYSEVTASNLVKINAEGAVLDGSVSRGQSCWIYGAQRDSQRSRRSPLCDAYPHHRGCRSRVP